MTATALWLAVGSAGGASPASGVNLMDDTAVHAAWGTLDLGTYYEGAEFRQVSVKCYVRAAAIDTLLGNIIGLGQLLEDAARALGQGDVWAVSPVCLWVKLGGATNWTYFDVIGLPTTVQSGSSTSAPPGSASLHLEPEQLGALRAVTLSFGCLPAGRGDPVAVTVSGTLTNGTGGTLLVSSVPGDLRAPAKLTVVDVSPAAGLATPTGLAVVTSTTGGVIAISSVCNYRVSATGGGGETLAAARVSVTTATTNTSSNTLTWNAVPGAGGYNVYANRANSTELLIASLPNTSLSYVDTGAVTPSGALPVSNTSKHVLNDLRIGVKSARDLAGGDFTPVIAATPAVPTVYSVYLGGATGGTWTLTFGANTTATISNPSLAQPYQVQQRFVALASVGAGNATVGGSGTLADPYIITFTGTLASAVQGAVTANFASLTGGASPTISRTSPTSFTDATAIGGSCARLTAAANATGFYPQAYLPGPVSGAYQSGRRDVWLRARLSTTLLPAPVGFHLNSSGGGGGLPDGTYTAEIVAFDANGTSGYISSTVSITLVTGGAGLITWAWTPPAGASTLRVYYLGPSGVWKYLALGGVATSTALSSDAQTAGNPPSAPSTSASLVPLAAVATPVASLARSVQGRTMSPAIGNGIWEYVRLDTMALAPIDRREDGTLPAWQLGLQGQITGGASTLDVDGAWLFPADEPQLHAQFSGLQSYSAGRTWVLDTRRDLAASGLATDGSNPQGQLAVDGYLTLGPGNNQLVFMASGVGGCSDVANLQFTVQVTYVPRFRVSRGSA